MSGSGERPQSARRFIEDGFAASMLAIDTTGAAGRDEDEPPPFLRVVRFLGEHPGTELAARIGSLDLDVATGATCIYFPAGIGAGELVLHLRDTDERIIVPPTPDSLVVVPPATAFELVDVEPIVLQWPT